MTDLAEFKARLPVVEIVRRFVKLHRAGPLWKGLCPFHQEKTPSFTVTEARGTYHCFGCGAHGNGLDFLMAIEGLDFADAVARAAELTGLEPPLRQAPDPERQRSAALVDVLEVANRWYRRQLRGEAGARARAYLLGRGVEPASVERFELGVAPDGRDRLTQALSAEGLDVAALVEAGLTLLPDGGGAPHDRFRDRLMFPIRDRRGRLVGFGGRALGDGAKAKYLNSPEGPLFRKRELLYGAHALPKPQERGRLHLVEGYLDVIALAQAGLAAVAPLGTAVTPAQLEEAWRLDPTPLVCLDGDAAGERAAGRLAELAFEHLGAGRSLTFAHLPEGEDPDSLIRRQGRAGFARAVADPRSLGATLLRHLAREVGGQGPEARAALRKRLRETVERIPDKDVRQEYAREFRAWLDPRGAGTRRVEAPTRRRPLAVPLRQVESAAAVELLRPLLEEPALLGPFGDALAGLALPEGWDRIRDALLAHAAADEPLEREALLAHFSTLDFDRGMLAVLSQPSRLFTGTTTRGEREEVYGRLINMHALRAALRLERENRAQAWRAGDGAAASAYALAIADLEDRLARLGRDLDGSPA